MAIFLVGYMGCGKSTIARKLSRRLGIRCIDTDAEVERREGAAIVDIFHYNGEAYFRRAERAVLEDIVAEGGDAVVATGGGLPVWGDNMDYMNRMGRTVYICRTAEQIASRLSPYGRMKRPKLRGLNDEELVEFMRAGIESRREVYERCMLTVDGGAHGDDEIVSIIIDWLER